MTTVVSPGSSPAPAYNEEGRTLGTITASGTDASTATVIVQFTQKTIVLVNASTVSGSGVVLPAGAKIGDNVEILYAFNLPGAPGIQLYVASGDTYNGILNNGDTVSIGAVFRKVSATNWLKVSAH